MKFMDGFSFQGYRSFATDTPAVLAPLGKINLIAGQNNSGKSNVLRAIADTYYEKPLKSSRWDRPLGDAEHSYVRQEFHTIDSILTWDRIAALQNPSKSHLEQILNRLGLVAGGVGELGFWFEVGGKGAHKPFADDQFSAEERQFSYARELSRALTGTTGGGVGSNLARVLNWVAASRPTPRKAVTIAGIREISDDSDDEPDLNGRSIKRRLLELQNPATDRLRDKETFLAVQEFVRTVLGEPSITIDIPHDLATIHVTQGGRTLPIENLGTGIHEVVIIAAAATITTNMIICIEEPEVHLHPILQRKLLRHLAHNTTNQYFIATHSAHMLDSELGSIFHISLEAETSIVRFAGAARDRAAVCADLGYRPSDLVQTNAILWVEGPSDRIYLKHWIDQLAPGQFIEGTHYSIMFYGGALLSALSPLDVEEVDEFISLRKLNRYMAVVIDSDKLKPRAKLNESKMRVIKELDDDPATSYAWVTAGYTIENYVPVSILDAAVKAAHPSTSKLTLEPFDRYANPLSQTRLGLKASKVSVAKKAVAAYKDEWPYGLKKEVQAVIDLIRSANSHL